MGRYTVVHIGGGHPGGYISPLHTGRHPGGYISPLYTQGGTLVGISPIVHTERGTLVGISHLSTPERGTLVGIAHSQHPREAPWWVLHFQHPREAPWWVWAIYASLGMVEGGIYRLYASLLPCL